MKALRSRFVRPLKSLPPGLIFIIRNAAVGSIPTAVLVSNFPTVDDKGSRRGHH